MADVYVEHVVETCVKDAVSEIADNVGEGDREVEIVEKEAGGEVVSETVLENDLVVDVSRMHQGVEPVKENELVVQIKGSKW